MESSRTGEPEVVILHSTLSEGQNIGNLSEICEYLDIVWKYVCVFVYR